MSLHTIHLADPATMRRTPAVSVVEVQVGGVRPKAHASDAPIGLGVCDSGFKHTRPAP